MARNKSAQSVAITGFTAGRHKKSRSQVTPSPSQYRVQPRHEQVTGKNAMNIRYRRARCTDINTASFTSLQLQHDFLARVRDDYAMGIIGGNARRHHRRRTNTDAAELMP